MASHPIHVKTHWSTKLYVMRSLLTSDITASAPGVLSSGYIASVQSLQGATHLLPLHLLLSMGNAPPPGYCPLPLGFYSSILSVGFP